VNTTDPSAASSAAGDATPAPAGGAAAAAPPGGRYRLLAEIAHGGMGVIWRATDTALGREVAVKVLQDKYAPDSGVARRFAAEARITAQLQHPAIPPVHDCGSLPDGRPFLAMKLVRGQTLDELLRQRRDLSAKRGRFVAAFEQVCQALAYAHAHRVLHRDLKPGNIMVGGFGEVQVMDWGLAKVLGEAAAPAAPESDPGETAAGTRIRGSDPEGPHGSETQEGSILGTLAYMPPEQAAGEVARVDPRSDVFGLGAILAVILTGAPPYVNAGAEALRVMAIRGDLAACLARLDGCGAEPELVALCQRCLAFAPEQRPRDAGAVAEEVARLRAAAEERARAAERERAAAEARAAEQRRKRRWQLAAAGAVVLALLAGVGGLAAFLQAQKQANAELRAANDREHQRFELALDAIKTFHTGVSEDDLLKQAEFKVLRERLLREAARFYGRLQEMLEGQPDASSRRALAQSYFLLAELTQAIGSTDDSLALHRKALELRRQLAGRGEATADVDVARSLLGLASGLEDRGDFAEARKAAEEARAVAEAAGSSEEALIVLAHSQHTVGLASYKMRDWDECLRHFRQALEIRKRLVDANPGNAALRRSLAGGYNSVGAALGELGRYAESLQMQQKALEIYEKEARDNPTDADLQDLYARARFNCGSCLADMGKPEQATSEFVRAVEIEQKAIDAYPAAHMTRNNQAFFRVSLGDNLYLLGRFEEALRAYRQAATALQALADAHPTIISYLKNLAASRMGMAKALTALAKPAEALPECDQALALWRKLAGDPPTRFQFRIASTLALRGAALRKFGRAGEAVAAYREATALAERPAKPGPRDLYTLACCYALLHGIARDKGSGLTAADGDAAAERALAALRRAVAAGHRELGVVRTDPALDSLRKRPDFQKLLADLEKEVNASGK
jgi:tetratricopeptide (TPR) repeat protein